MKPNTDNSDKKKYTIDDITGRYWCRVIEKIAQNVIQNTLRTTNVEKFAEVVITGINRGANTVNCRNIHTGESLNDIPNYSNISMASLVDAEGRELPYPTRGRLFITDIKDNPYYLGVWYN